MMYGNFSFLFSLTSGITSKNGAIKSDEELKAGKVVVKTMEELESMEN